MKTQKIIIGDNSKHFREGLKRILQNIGDVVVVGESDNGLELVSMIEREMPDIVFLDIILNELNGIDVTSIIHAKYPDVIFIGFSSLENVRYANRMIEAGANGFLRKSGDNYEVFQQIIKNKSGWYFTPGLAQKDNKLSLSGGTIHL